MANPVLERLVTANPVDAFREAVRNARTAIGSRHDPMVEPRPWRDDEAGLDDRPRESGLRGSLRGRQQRIYGPSPAPPTISEMPAQRGVPSFRDPRHRP